MIDISLIPKDPGCYLFKDKNKKIIYIGKAKNLKKRVNSYFQKKDHDPKTKLMLQHAISVDFIVTDNEVEALLLENNLIKKNKPKFNIDLKDSKRYAHILLTEEKFPRLLLARKKEGKGKFFGPFVSAATRNYVMFTLRRTFRLRTCKRMPKKPCLRYHINLCYAPCAGHITQKDYNENLEAVETILKGKTSILSKELTTKMKKSSKEQNYELALELKNRIEAIQYLKEKQKMERERKTNEDIINYKIHNGIVYLMLFNVNRGTLENKQQFEFDEQEEFLETFLAQYYSENHIPTEIIIPKKINPIIKELLERKRGKRVTINTPTIGEKKQLLKLVEKNIEIQIFGNSEKLEDLKDKLNLNDTPIVIECFDISHISGTSTVGSMVQFRNAKPDKNNYRRFKIQTVEGIDDVRAMAEVIRRRYYKLVIEKSDLPNLILIDGGKGQLNFALKELENLNLKIPIISIAKKLEEIYIPGRKKPIILDKKTKALKLLQQLRDEAHRFAISYNRLLRKKKLIK